MLKTEIISFCKLIFFMSDQVFFVNLCVSYRPTDKSWANEQQSLKLTEPAADVVAANCNTSAVTGLDHQPTGISDVT
jgi:hypothetical protein